MNTKHPYDIKNITPMVKSADSVSDWWQAYNFIKATLKNVLYARADLFSDERIP